MMTGEMIMATRLKGAASVSKNTRHRFLMQYELACSALNQCSELIDAKAIADKAEALAALAKIHGDGGGIRQAKILKLRAYRRMGEMAREISAERCAAKGVKGRDAKDGILPILRKAALSHTEAKGAMTLARLSAEQMGRLENRKTILSVTSSNSRVVANFDFLPARDVMRALALLVSTVRGVTPRQFKDYAAGRADRGTNLDWRQLAEEVRDFLEILLERN